MDRVTWGRGTSYFADRWDRNQPWHRASHDHDPRNSPLKGGGRRLRHPFLDPIVYPRVPDATLNFGVGSPLRKVPTIVTKTLDSSAIVRFPERPEDVVIVEIFNADSASTIHEFFNAMHRYLLADLPPGRVLGWQPRDLSPRSFAVDLISVELGSPEAFNYQEIGDRRPFLLGERMVIKLKMRREVEAPSGVVSGQGA